ncbi:hypothetical protein HR060_06220 [Catenovulum sp. SM1970]|uniref:hypothetical protein n=1 Tax=Marinifaba aquimaris TaxID=2741323 RepID=UPI001572A160|nr:hypothetical protein [Marinifaba aquimaris]NTS76461.1 hypothetical protein [Marinifaba aquimaris]
MFDYVYACGLMALAIGTDVVMATLLQRQALQKHGLLNTWLVGVSLSHTLLPAAGYLLTLASMHFIPTITPWVGVFAFVCIAIFLYQEFTASDEDVDSLSHFRLITFALILTVSWDALWSGPAKSAQVVGWQQWHIISSFFVVGLLVWSMAKFSLWVAQFKFPIASSYGVWLGRWLQFSVLGYFAGKALVLYTLGWQVADLTLLVIASLIVKLLMLWQLAVKTKRPLQLN